VTRSIRPLACLVLSLTVAAACAARPPRTLPPSAAAPPRVPVMGSAVLTASQLAAWFASRPGTAERYRASVPVETLTRYYLEEGAAEGVAGDLAFLQAVVETGWFRFEGRVEPGHNNFAGLGATGAPGAEPARFPDARLGVRAHVQHLRAYADATAVACASPPLAHPCADPRFHLVAPKGKAPAWNDMGNGNWATARAYADTILALHRSALAHSGR
jgi:hypothetical protein